MILSDFDFEKQTPEVYYKKDVLKNFAKLTEKHLCQSPFFNKIAGLRPASLLKKRLWHRYFPVNFAKFSKTTFFIEHLWWLLLNFEFFCHIDWLVYKSLLNNSFLIIVSILNRKNKLWQSYICICFSL